jgi:hypothetical protein
MFLLETNTGLNDNVPRSDHQHTQETPMKRLLVVSALLLASCSQSSVTKKEFSVTKIASDPYPRYHLVVPPGDYDSKIDTQNWVIRTVSPSIIKKGEKEFVVDYIPNPERLIISVLQEGPSGGSGPGINLPTCENTLCVYRNDKSEELLEFDVLLRPRGLDPGGGAKNLDEPKAKSSPVN